MSPADPDPVVVLSAAEYDQLLDDLARPPRVIEPLLALIERVRG